jgi:hypothetical protein
MSRCAILAAACAVVPAAACYKTQHVPPMAASVNADRTVFTDSVLHRELCQPGRPGEYWRAVCVPKDQGDGAVFKKP